MEPTIVYRGGGMEGWLALDAALGMVAAFVLGLVVGRAAKRRSRMTLSRRLSLVLALALSLARPAAATLTPPSLQTPVCSSGQCQLQWTNPMECASPTSSCSVVTENRAWIIERSTDHLFLSNLVILRRSGIDGEGTGEPWTTAGAMTYTDSCGNPTANPPCSAPLANGTTYYYRIRAYPYSNTVSGAPAAATTTTVTTLGATTTTTTTTAAPTTTTTTVAVTTTTVTGGSTTTTLPGTGAFVWNKRFGGSVSADQTFAHGVATDGSNNVFVSGTFGPAADFGGGTLTSTGGDDGFLVKYNSAGTFQWQKKLGGAGNDQGLDVAVDGANNVFYAGYFAGTSDYGTGPLTSLGANDAVVAKYAGSTGAAIWTKRFGSTGADTGYAVAVDASGDVYLGGYFSGSVPFGATTLVSVGSYDMYVAKLDGSTGNVIWAKRGGGAASDQVQDLAVDPAGAIVAAGKSFSPSVDYGLGAHSGLAGYTAFLVKYDATTGAPAWDVVSSGASDEQFLGVTVDPSSNVIATGGFSGTASFGGGNVTDGGGGDIVIAKYNAAGVHQWTKDIGTSLISGEGGRGIAADASGNFILGATVADNQSGFVGCGTLTGNSFDPILAKFTGAGTCVWAKRSAVVNSDHMSAVAVDSAGSTLAVGDFTDGVNWGGGQLSGPSTLVDSFLVKLAP